METKLVLVDKNTEFLYGKPYLEFNTLNPKNIRFIHCALSVGKYPTNVCTGCKDLTECNSIIKDFDGELSKLDRIINK